MSNVLPPGSAAEGPRAAVTRWLTADGLRDEPPQPLDTPPSPEIAATPAAPAAPTATTPAKPARSGGPAVATE